MRLILKLELRDKVRKNATDDSFIKEYFGVSLASTILFLADILKIPHFRVFFLTLETASNQNLICV